MHAQHLRGNGQFALVCWRRLVRSVGARVLAGSIPQVFTATTRVRLCTCARMIDARASGCPRDHARYLNAR